MLQPSSPTAQQPNDIFPISHIFQYFQISNGFLPPVLAGIEARRAVVVASLPSHDVRLAAVLGDHWGRSSGLLGCTVLGDYWGRSSGWLGCTRTLMCNGAVVCRFRVTCPS